MICKKTEVRDQNLVILRNSNFSHSTRYNRVPFFKRKNLEHTFIGLLSFKSISWLNEKRNRKKSLVEEITANNRSPFTICFFDCFRINPPYHPRHLCQSGVAQGTHYSGTLRDRAMQKPPHPPARTPAPYWHPTPSISSPRRRCAALQV